MKKKEKDNARKQLDQVSQSIIESRKLLTIIQKVQIESNRAKGWALANIFGTGLFTRQSKFNSFDRIEVLLKEAKSQHKLITGLVSYPDLTLGVSTFSYFTDVFINNSLASLFQHNKVRKLAKESALFASKLDDFILLLEAKELELQKVYDQL